MNYHSKKIKGLGLCSGGLDSILSALVLRRQKVAVCWISFETPFFSAEKARRAADNHGIELIVRDITDQYLPMLKNPRCGYGRHMNPCMDCHALMFRIAGEMMEAAQADFLFSGEVLGQRPVSQNRQSLRYVEKHSGHDGSILRPLSARLLPETVMEQQGLVNREMLYGLSGRSRKPQMAMAKEFGIEDYPAPAGGCLLTDKGFSLRLRDLFEHQENQTVEELHLLKHGRHLRLDRTTKIVVGRNKADNEAIFSCFRPNTDILIKTIGFPGPLVLIPNGGEEALVHRAAAIGAGYGKAPADQQADMGIMYPGGQKTIRVSPIPHAEVSGLLIP